MFDEPRPPDHALMQDPAFATALRLCGQRPVTLPGGRTVLMQRIAGIRVAMLPRAVPPDDLTDQLRAVKLHRHPLILSPDMACKLPHGLRLCQPRELAWLDLTGGIDQCRARLHSKWRNQLRLAEKHRVRVTCKPMDPDPNSQILKQEQEQCRLQGYLNWPAPLTATFASVAPKQTHLFRACHNGQTIAHMLYLSHGATATYHIGHTTPQGRAFAAHNLLLWGAVERFANLGYQRLDLGLLDPRTPALNHFKLRTGAISHQTGGTYLCWRPLAHG